MNEAYQNIIKTQASNNNLEFALGKAKPIETPNPSDYKKESTGVVDADAEQIEIDEQSRKILQGETDIQEPTQGIIISDDNEDTTLDEETASMFEDEEILEEDSIEALSQKAETSVHNQAGFTMKDVARNFTDSNGDSQVSTQDWNGDTEPIGVEVDEVDENMFDFEGEMESPTIEEDTFDENAVVSDEDGDDEGNIEEDTFDEDAVTSEEEVTPEETFDEDAVTSEEPTQDEELEEDFEEVQYVPEDIEEEPLQEELQEEPQEKPQTDAFEACEETEVVAEEIVPTIEEDYETAQPTSEEPTQENITNHNPIQKENKFMQELGINDVAPIKFVMPNGEEIVGGTEVENKPLFTFLDSTLVDNAVNNTLSDDKAYSASSYINSKSIIDVDRQLKEVFETKGSITLYTPTYYPACSKHVKYYGKITLDDDRTVHVYSLTKIPASTDGKVVARPALTKICSSIAVLLNKIATGQVISGKVYYRNNWGISLLVQDEINAIVKRLKQDGVRLNVTDQFFEIYI